MGEIGKSLEMQNIDALECCNQSLMCDSSGSLEDVEAKRNTNSEGQAHKFSNGNRDCIKN